MRASSGLTESLGLRAGWPLTRTCPARMARLARSRLSQRPRSTSAWSRRIMLKNFCETLVAALYERREDVNLRKQHGGHRPPLQQGTSLVGVSLSQHFPVSRVL